MSDHAVIEALRDGRRVFGLFEPDWSVPGGAATAAHPDVDFVFYDLEKAAWDMAALRAFVGELAEACGQPDAPPILLRIPPVRDDPEAARARVAEGLAAGARGLILPHVESPGEIALAADIVGARLWPTHADGDVVVVALIEDRDPVGRARDIVAATGLAVVVPAQMDLREAYDHDEAAVQGAVKEVLAVCTELGVPCGVTADAHDVRARLEQGFDVIIARRLDVVALGRGGPDRETRPQTGMEARA